MRQGLFDYCRQYHKDALLSEWDTVKNAPLTPQTVAYSSHICAWWRCANGHEWQAAVYSRTGGSDCHTVPEKECRPVSTTSQHGIRSWRGSGTMRKTPLRCRQMSRPAVTGQSGGNAKGSTDGEPLSVPVYPAAGVRYARVKHTPCSAENTCLPFGGFHIDISTYLEESKLKKRMISLLLCFCMLLSLLPTVALANDVAVATSGTCGAEGNESNVTWTFENGTLTISGTGAMKNFTANSQKDERPWKDYISSITKGIVAHGVTNVGDRTFYNCLNMASVELADGITSITGGAFENCTSLTSLALPNSLEKFGGNAFKGCTGLTGELVIPDSVREIKNWAFMNCTSISSVSIGKNVESISESAFEKCQSLKSITFKGKTKTIGLKAFRETSLMSLTLPDGLETIGPDAFYGIATLSGMLVIPDSVTKIENQAFWTGRTNGEGAVSNISGIRVDSPKIHIGNSAFKATGADYIDLTRVDELSSWGNWVLDENESCIIYAQSDSVLGKVKNSQHVTNYIYAFTSGGIFAENTVFLTDTLATPVKDGYAFTGWYTDEACTNKLDTTPAANSTYYAKWEEAAASVNGVGYTTLGAAITAAQDGDTIMLLKDVTENVTIPEGKERTLDLNGKNITVNSGCAIVNKGNLTVTGNGEVTAEKAAVANFPGAVANLNGGTYSSSNWYVIKNLGTMTIDGPVTVKKPDGSTDTSSLIDNGWYGNSDNDMNQDYPTSAVEVKLTIKSGDFSGKAGSDSCSVVKNDDYGVLEITGGTFDSSSNTGTSDATTILNWNVATISGGTFIGSYPISNGSYNNDADQGKLTISGGDFTGTSFLLGQATGGTPAAAKLSITGGIFNAPSFGEVNYKIEISGGSFTMDPTKYVVDGYVVNHYGDKYIVGNSTPDPIFPSYGFILPAVIKEAPELNTMSHTAYVEGYPDGTVKPNGKITRAEVAAILYRLMTEDSRKTYVTTKSGFYDVDSSKWYNTYVATLNNAGVITDSSNGYFRPDDAITRAELAAMLTQFAKTKGGAYSFTDVTVEHWAAYAIAVCANLGWINGYPDGTFRPDATVTRAEMMAMVNRATGRSPKLEAAKLSAGKLWSDNTDKTAWYYLDVQEATSAH